MTEITSDGMRELVDALAAERELCDKLANALRAEIIYGNPGDNAQFVMEEYERSRNG